MPNPFLILTRRVPPPGPDTQCATKQDLVEMERRLTLLFQRNQYITMRNLDEVLAKVAEETTVEQSLITLTGSIKTQLDSVLAGNLTPEQAAKVDAIFDGVEANRVKAAEAILANTPAATAS